MSSEWVVLLEHTKGAAHVLDAFKSLGVRIAYIGRNPAISSKSDLSFEVNILKELDHFLEKHLDQLRALNPIAVIGFMENTKQAEEVIASKLGVLKNDSRIYKIFRDKVIFREFCRDNGVTTVDFAFIRDSEKVERAPLPFPFIIKPNFGYASGGVRLVKNQEEFFEALKGIRRLNRFVFQNESSAETGAICEEFLTGAEYAIDSITVDGRTRSLNACLRGFPSTENFCDFTYFTPCENQDHILSEAEQTLSKLFESSGFRYGPSHSEFRWCDRRKKLVLLEVGARVGFVGNIGRLCEKTSGIEYNALAIRAMLGRLSSEELVAVRPRFKKFGLSLTPDTGSGGRITAIRGYEQLQSNPSIVSHYFTKSVGDVVVPYPRGIEYLGEILLVDEDEGRFETNVRWLLSEFRFEFEPI